MSTRSIQLKHCRIDVGLPDGVYKAPSFVVTHFEDGTSWGSAPHPTPEYEALALRCGYTHGYILWRYCVEHDIAHAIIAQELYDEPPRVILGCARGVYASRQDILHEEALAIELQAFARANALPGSSAPGWSWHDVRAVFLAACSEVFP